MKGERLGMQAGGWRGGRLEAGAGDRARDTRQQAAPARHEIHALLLEVVCTVRLAIGFLLVVSKWCAQSQLAIGF